MGYPIVVRMDDIFPAMNEAKFLKYKALFEELGIRPLLGVIPDCFDENIRYGLVEEFWEKITELKNKNWPIAMHGYHHVYVSSQKGLVCRRKKSEFAGLPEQQQYEMILKGKEILKGHGLDTDVFMAPGHSYDKVTLRALKRAGFSVITDGRSLHPYVCQDIQCIPARSAYRLHFAGLLTICVHCSAEEDRDFERLHAFLIQRRNDVIDFDTACRLPQRPYWISRIEEKVSLCAEALLVLLCNR